jgi:tRNA (cmo5U34)-methyltransferase
MPDRDTSERFYDRLAPRYDDAILRCVPRYAEMLDTLLHYVPDHVHPTRILELGCGGGNLTERLVARFEQADVHAVDFSAEMLERTSDRVRSDRLHTIHSDFRRLDFEAESFDLVVSTIALHHLDDEAKQDLFADIHRWLRPGGAFCYSDQFAGDTAATYAKHMATWEREAQALGVTTEEWAAWMQHQRDHDHHAPLRAQVQWLEDAGFDSVDCVWRHLLWTIVIAERDTD